MYLTLISSPNRQGRVTIGVAVNPMMLWLWLGGGVLALGTIVALTPNWRPEAAARGGESVPSRADREPGIPAERATTEVAVVKHPVRWIALAVRARSWWCSRSILALQSATTRETRTAATSLGKAAPVLRPAGARRRPRPALPTRRRRGDRELLELLVHPVPAGA